MGWNYLQTDDRDDYFASFRDGGGIKYYTLIDPNGEIKIETTRKQVLRHYAKRYISGSAKKIWGKVLIDRGYTIQTNKTITKE